jgi:hypothetical protein
MQNAKGSGLADISEQPKHTQRKDRPADVEALAVLVDSANNGAGLAYLKLELPPQSTPPPASGQGNRGNQTCARCDWRELCANRVALRLWAVCEKPWANDLHMLRELIDIQINKLS